MKRKNFEGGGRGHHPSERGIVRKIDSTATYFVPSFSIRRHASRSAEADLERMQREVRRKLGGQFAITSPSQLTLKVISQSQFIRNIRAADLHPSAEDMRGLAFDIRDGLTEVLDRAPSPLRVPLGRLSVFGFSNQALGIELEGWKGHRARYAMHDADRSMTPHGALVSESQFCLDSIAASFEGTGYDEAGILNTPHVTIARYGKDIRDSTLRDIRQEISDLIPDEIEMGDPVIEFRGARETASEVLYVRHAWQSLAAF